MVREDASGEASEDLGDGGSGPPAVAVEPVEHGKRGERGDHVFRLLDRAARTELVFVGQPLGQRAQGLVRNGEWSGQVAVQGRLDRPASTGIGQKPEKLLPRGTPDLGRRLEPDQAAEKSGARAEAVVDRDPRNARPPGYGAHAERRTGGHEIPGGRDDALARLVHRRLPFAEPVGAHGNNLNILYVQLDLEAFPSRLSANAKPITRE